MDANSRVPLSPAAATTPAVLLVESNSSLQRLLADWVGYALPECRIVHAVGIVRAAAIAARARPAAVLVDLDTCDAGPHAAFPLLRSAAPRARLIAVSMFHAGAHRSAALAAGAALCLAIGDDVGREMLLGPGMERSS